MEQLYLAYLKRDGSLARARARMLPVKARQTKEQIVQNFEQLTEVFPHSTVVETFDGSKITVARMKYFDGSPIGDYKYGLIYQRLKPESYSVFYVSSRGAIVWVAGPQEITFYRAWREFLHSLQ